MTDRPIIFSGPMVRAILDGRKTQTRRVVKPQPDCPDCGHECLDMCLVETIRGWSDGWNGYVRCPYGIPGDRLWVRESAWYGPQEGRVEYDADFDDLAAEAARAYGATRRPSIYMSKSWCRLWLEVVTVRVERLHEIGQDDARAEGVEASETVEQSNGDDEYRLPFELLWGSLHGIENPESWESNPWVWVVEFKRTGA